MTTLSEKHEFIITIPSASIMRERAEKCAKERKEECIKEEIIAKQKHEEEMLIRLPKIISLIMEDIIKATEQGETWLNAGYWYVDETRWGMQWYEVEEFAPILIEMLGKAGYKMSSTFWTYSESWRKRSGKGLYGGSISWKKE